jgi:hypothetical protein
MTTSTIGIPTYLCKEVKGQNMFWCPWCLAWHHHGRIVGDRTEHRLAHCTSKAGREAHANGYYIKRGRQA